MPKALEGVRMLEPGRFFAGPGAGTLLGDMGAEIIRYEEPGVGDPLRRGFPPLPGGVGPYFLWSARNKKSITLNLRVPKGQEIFKELVKVSDVVLENFTPGTMEKWGLGYEDLKKINPGVIMCSTSMYGQWGPYKDRQGFDYLAQAATGMMYANGEPDGPPTYHQLALSDYIGAFATAHAIQSALFYRQRTGIGQHLDVSLFESSAWFQEYNILHYTYFGEIRKPKMARGVSPICRSFPCTDGDVFIVGTVTPKKNTLRAIGREDLVGDPRFPDDRRIPLTPEAIDDLAGLIENWTKGRTRAEAMDRLIACEVIAAPVNSVADLVNDPHYIARGNLVEVDHPEAGKLKMQGPIVKMSETPPSVDTPPPLLGEHNDQIYGSLLNLSRQQLEELKSEGVI